MLDQIQQYLVPRTYVEVGVSKGTSLTLALPGTTCVGVDPEPDIQFPLLSSAKIYRLTSDAFFEEVDLPAQLGQFSVDLAFIDGMHLFEFALRDFMNLERYSSRDTTILIHDCLPTDEASRCSGPGCGRWSGDVWKVIVLSCACGARILTCQLSISGPADWGSSVDSTRPRPGFGTTPTRSTRISSSSRSALSKSLANTDLMGLVPGDWRPVAAACYRAGPSRANLYELKRRGCSGPCPHAHQWAMGVERRPCVSEHGCVRAGA